MIDSIVPLILAAGRGSRFGPDMKLLYKIKDRFILEMTLDAYINNFKVIIVITGYEKDRIEKKITDLGFEKIITLFNEQWNVEGMSSSVKKGVDFIYSNYNPSGVLVQPGDMPFISEKDIKIISNEAEKKGYQKLIIPQFKGKNGHPLFIPKNLFSEVLKINERTHGLKSVITKFSDLIVSVDCSSGVIQDIDSKEDLK